MMRLLVATALTAVVLAAAWSGSRCPVPQPPREGFQDSENVRRRVLAVAERMTDPKVRRTFARMERGEMTDAELASIAARGELPAEVFDALVEKAAPAKEATRDSEDASPPGPGQREGFCELSEPLVMG